MEIMTDMAYIQHIVQQSVHRHNSSVTDYKNDYF